MKSILTILAIIGSGATLMLSPIANTNLKSESRVDEYEMEECHEEHFDDDYEFYDETELEEMLGRSLTEEEQAALEIVKAIPEDVWESEEFTPEQEQALELVFELFEEHIDDDYEVYEDIVDREDGGEDTEGDNDERK